MVSSSKKPAGDVARAFVIGAPISHSRSPLIHGHWLKQHGIEASYNAIHVAPDELPCFLDELNAKKRFRGGNVTIPHKEATCEWLSERADCALTPHAKSLGAVNTLYFINGVLTGDNTDGGGFLANLDQSAPGWDADLGHVLVIGAGGAARAVVAALTGRMNAASPSARTSMTIANRTLARAQTLAEELGPEGAKAVSLSELSSALKTATCVVNTSSLGMSGKENAGQDGLPFSLADLPPEAFVTDIVYTPLQTPLLEVAQKRGCRTADGLGMLLHQAVPGFEKWFGVLPQVTPSLRSMILKDMGLAE